jgi:hypothetical protein
MNKKRLEESTFPALYQAADKASLDAQSSYYFALCSYLILLVVAAYVSFYWPNAPYGALASAALFLVTLGILIWLKVKKPEDTWYNGRAVAESIKTRTWRWVMKAEPYENNVPDEQIQKEFLSDLKSILVQNRSLSSSLEWNPNLGEAISDEMMAVRKLSLPERLDVYKKERIDDQSIWYSKKSQFNKRRAKQWFVVSIVLHSAAVLMLLYRIKEPATSLPIGVIATAASAVLTWLQAKKHNELNSAYSLAAHEIVIIKSESVSIKTDHQLSDLVVNSEAAFSREHTQWTARKNV